jgi:hypothetical protein
MTERAASTQCARECDEGGALGRGKSGFGGRKLRCRVMRIAKYELERTALTSWTGRTDDVSLYLDGCDRSVHYHSR